MKLVAVTACPTGIAHTYMAAESLQRAAREEGFQLKVETRGAVGIENELTQADILNADAVILAVAITVNKERFVGKPILEVPITEAIRNPKAIFQQAVEIASSKNLEDQNLRNEKVINHKKDENKSGFELPKPIMFGVSHIIPFLTVTGIFITLNNYWHSILFKSIGELGHFTLIPIIAGSIALSIADRPGLTPGIISGLIAVSKPYSGVLGGIVGGLLSGWVTNLLKKVKLPKELNGLLPVFFIPALTSLIIGFVMIDVLGVSLGFLQSKITEFFINLPYIPSILLGAFLGIMLAYDLGGPINKIAYGFGLLMMVEKVYGPQAAIIASGMVPSLAAAFVTLLFPKYFSDFERKKGRKAWLLGLAFVAEGAKPFLEKNPIQRKIAFMIGGAASGVMSMALQITAVVPHGGILAVFFVNHPLYFLLSIITGTVISTLAMLIAK